MWILLNRIEYLGCTFSREGAYPVATRNCMETWQGKTDIFTQVSTYGRYIQNPGFTSHSRDNEKLESMKVWNKSMPVIRLYLRIGSQLTWIHYPLRVFHVETSSCQPLPDEGQDYHLSLNNSIADSDLMTLTFVRGKYKLTF